MNGTTAFCGVGSGTAMTVLTGVIGVEPRIGVLRRGARQHQHGHEMHDAAKQHAGQQPEQPAHHGHALVTIAGIGASRAARVATPTGES